MYKEPMDNAKVGKGWGWEVEVCGMGEIGGRKMETTVLDQQSKVEKIHSEMKDTLNEINNNL